NCIFQSISASIKGKSPNRLQAGKSRSSYKSLQLQSRGTCPTGHGNASSRRGGASDRRFWVSGPRDRRELVARSGGDEALAGGGRPGVIGEGGEVPAECQPWNRRPSRSDDAVPAGVGL